MKEFTIDPAYFKSVTVRKEWNMYIKDNDPTPEEMLLVLKGKGWCSLTSSEEHPEFTELRETLNELGYIHVERNYVNGDRVLKPFKLNGLILETGDQFRSASAFGTRWELIQRHPEYYREGYWN